MNIFHDAKVKNGAVFFLFSVLDALDASSSAGAAGCFDKHGDKTYYIWNIT